MSDRGTAAVSKPAPRGREADERESARIDRETVGIVSVFLLCALLIYVSRFVSPALGSWQQVSTVLVLASFLCVLSFGQGIVILTGGLDLSMPALITLGGVLATSWAGGPGEGYMLVAVLLVCAGVGLLSGSGILLLGIPPFIMTMATSIIVSSVALGFTRGSPRGSAPPVLVAFMKGTMLGVPLPIWMLASVALLGWTLQSRSVVGRYLYAIGVNREAARIAGVPAGVVSLVPYVLSATCAGLTGFMLVGYANGATLRMGDNYLLPSIAAVVIGGSSILGGRGSYIGTVGGAILLTILSTIIAAVGLGQGWRTVIEGGIILLALLLLREGLFERLRSPRRSPGETGD